MVPDPPQQDCLSSKPQLQDTIGLALACTATFTSRLSALAKQDCPLLTNTTTKDALPRSREHPQPRGPMDPGTQHISSTREGNGFSVWLSHLLLRIQDKVISVTLTFLLGPPLLYLTEGNSIPFGLPCWVWFGLVNVGNLSWAYRDVCQTDTKNSNTELQRSPIGQCNKEDHCLWSAAGPAATCSPSPEMEAWEPPHLPHLHAKGTRAAHTPSLSFWCGLPASEPQPLLLAQAQPVVAVPPEQLSFNRATDLSMTRSSQTVMHSAAMNC